MGLPFVYECIYIHVTFTWQTPLGRREDTFHLHSYIHASVCLKMGTCHNVVVKTCEDRIHMDIYIYVVRARCLEGKSMLFHHLLCATFLNQLLLVLATLCFVACCSLSLSLSMSYYIQYSVYIYIHVHVYLHTHTQNFVYLRIHIHNTTHIQ